MPNEKDQFAQETKSIVDQPIEVPEAKTEDDQEGSTTQQTTGTDDTQTVDDEDSPKNRQTRRLAEKLQREREANIELAARLDAISEARKFSQQNEPAEYLKSVERIFGTNSPEAQEATEILKKAIQSSEDRATERALEAFREEQRKDAERVRKEGERLEGFVDEIEDTYNVTFTPALRKSYFTLLNKMSPKDDEGNPTAYADPHAVWEVLQERTKRAPDNKAKTISSRSMTPSGQAPAGNTQDAATVAYLRQMGILP